MTTPLRLLFSPPLAQLDADPGAIAPIWAALLISYLAMMFIAAVLTLAPKMGAGGRRFSDVLTRAPMLDVVVASLMWAPWIVAYVLGGWPAVGMTLLGQVLAFYSWVFLHELTHRKDVKGPRIVKTLNRLVGRPRNHAALWVSVLAIFTLWTIRISEIVIYPLFRMLLGFPPLRQADWVNVSRHKFEGLVGHDLIWCLYCDWMTGVYSLGNEMLRMVESFWCPIRFYEGKKCENCQIDFPDIDNGWVPADGSMADVCDTLEKMYGSGERGWFGSPTRLTVSAQTPTDPPTEEDEPK